MCISVRFFTYFKIHLFQVIVPKTNVEARQNNLLDFDCRSGKGFDKIIYWTLTVDQVKGLTK